MCQLEHLAAWKQTSVGEQRNNKSEANIFLIKIAGQQMKFSNSLVNCPACFSLRSMKSSPNSPLLKQTEH